MTERLFIIRGGDYPESLLETAAESLKAGAVLVHPTETVHGYGCRYDRPEGIERIGRIKGRRADKPMILLIPDRRWIEILCRDVSETALRLTELFWPGPLTLIFNAGDKARTAGGWIGETVALRQCAHPFTARLLKVSGLPMVSTSLNRSGERVPRDTRRFLEELSLSLGAERHLLPELAVIDEELERSGRMASTILSVAGKDTLRLVREGVLPLEEISAKIGGKQPIESGN